MPIEHRWSERKPIKLDVSIYYEPMGTITGCTRDVSLEGMFVETPGVELPLEAELEVSFETETSGKRQQHNMPAYVVHDSNGGVGLMLRHVDYNDFYALRYMLNAA
jgi:hypothetical protein